MQLISLAEAESTMGLTIFFISEAEKTEQQEQQEQPNTAPAAA